MHLFTEHTATHAQGWLHYIFHTRGVGVSLTKGPSLSRNKSSPTLCKHVFHRILYDSPYTTMIQELQVSNELLHNKSIAYQQVNKSYTGVRTVQ